MVFFYQFFEFGRVDSCQNATIDTGRVDSRKQPTVCTLMSETKRQYWWVIKGLLLLNAKFCLKNNKINNFKWIQKKLYFNYKIKLWWMLLMFNQLCFMLGLFCLFYFFGETHLFLWTFPKYIFCTWVYSPYINIQGVNKEGKKG